MKPDRDKWRLGFSCLLLFNSALADTSVWKISKDSRHLYLGGTVHILSSKDYPLPAAYENAYQSSHRLVFETDLARLKSPDFQQSMLQRLTYRNGETLADVLSARSYQNLKVYCDSRNMSIASLTGFKPGLVSIVLLTSELQRLDLSGVGVDEYFHSKAQQDARPTGQLETLDEQLDFLANMGKGREDALIEYTLRDIANLSALMKRLKQAWRNGDMAGLQRVALDPYIEAFPDTIEQLLGLRNDRWMPKIEAMLNTDEIEFVLVGALHLAGERGLLAQLRSLGYRIEQL